MTGRCVTVAQHIQVSWAATSSQAISDQIQWCEHFQKYHLLLMLMQWAIGLNDAGPPIRDGAPVYKIAQKADISVVLCQSDAPV